MINEYFAVFTLNGTLKLMNKALDTHGEDMLFYTNSLEEAKSNSRNIKSFKK